jgi:hypothetical protein
MFKERTIAPKIRRALKRRTRANQETEQKLEVRQRDRTCRFPYCGCKRFGLALHVSHSQHKGMGGNPAGDRSKPSLMVLVCSARHRENPVSLDKGTVRWEPLTRKGADGPVAWFVDIRELMNQELVSRLNLGTRWFEVARERRLGQLEMLTTDQVAILKHLARMLE